MMTIGKTFTFDCAHHLPEMPEGHKCRRPHGHTYRLTVYVTGAIHLVTGIVMDYAVIAERVQPVIDAIDHRDLNTFIPNPTTENLIVWIWRALIPTLPMMTRLELAESSTTVCVYEGQA